MPKESKQKDIMTKDIMKQEAKPKLSVEALSANLDYFRSLRIKAHKEYLAMKRLERETREQLHLLQPTSDSVEL